MKETFEEFEGKVLKRSTERKIKINHSVGVYDAYKYIRKNNWFNIGRPLTEHEFYTIIRSINKLYAIELSKGNSVIFPQRMGTLELRKGNRGVSLKNGKLSISYPINWKETLKLWYNDAEAKEQKILIRYENNTVYHVKYNKYRAVYNNKSYYNFAVNRAIKQQLHKNIEDGKVDAMFDEY